MEQQRSLCATAAKPSRIREGAACKINMGSHRLGIQSAELLALLNSSYQLIKKHIPGC